MGIVRISGLLFLVTLLGLASCGVAKPSGDSQPFARIAIHRARIALEKSSYATATPTLLGFGGKTSQWETITFSSQNASNNDWIADFSPASAVKGLGSLATPLGLDCEHWFNTTEDVQIPGDDSADT